MVVRLILYPIQDPQGCSLLEMEGIDIWVDFILHKGMITLSTQYAPCYWVMSHQGFCKGQQDQDSPVKLKALWSSRFSRDRWLLEARFFPSGCLKWGPWPADMLGLARRMWHRTVPPMLPEMTIQRQGWWWTSQAPVGPRWLLNYWNTCVSLAKNSYPSPAPHSHSDPCRGQPGPLCDAATKRLMPATAEGSKNAFWLTGTLSINIFLILPEPKQSTEGNVTGYTLAHTSRLEGIKRKRCALASPWNWLTCCTGYGFRCCWRCWRGKCDCCSC